MKSRLTLVITAEFPPDYDPTDHFVWYFSDDRDEPIIVSVDEHWEDIE